MDISCDIVRDLLPLYAEDMVSSDSRKLVDDHLCGCDECTKILGSIQKAASIPVVTEPESLQKIRKGIRRRRILSVMAASLTLITLASFVITYLFAPFQLTKEQALDDFYIREDGAVVIDYSPSVMGRILHGDGENWFIHQYSTRYDTWQGENRKSLEETFGADGIITQEERLRYDNTDIIYGMYRSADGKTTSDGPIPWEENGGEIVEWYSEKNWWYADPTGLGNDILLHDAGKEYPAYREYYSSVYPLVFFGGLAAALLFLFLQRLLKKSWMKELACRLCILCTSTAVSTLFVSSGRLYTSTVGLIDQYWGPMIAANTVLLALSSLLWLQLYRLNQRDMGF